MQYSDTSLLYNNEDDEEEYEIDELLSSTITRFCSWHSKIQTGLLPRSICTGLISRFDNSYHIRNLTVDEIFVYESRTQPVDDDPVLRGRCEIASHLSAAEAQRAGSLINACGKDETNIPSFGVGNCQDCLAGVVALLESAGGGLVASGEGRFWKGMINRSAQEMKDACLREEKKWIDRLAETVS